MPETDGPRKRIDFWRCVLKRRIGRKGSTHVSPRVWRRKKKAAKIKYSTKDMTPEEMWDKLREARKDYKKAKKEHLESRVKYLESLP